MTLQTRLIVTSGLITMFSACAPFAASVSDSVNQSSTSSGGDSPAAIAAFQNGFYAFTQQQGCVQCHSTLISPYFAAADVNAAYAAAKGNQIGSSAPLIDFTNPSASIFVQYAGNSHCAAAPCSDPTVEPNVQALLTTWANAELAATTSAGTTPTSAIAKYLTATMAIPPNLPPLTTAAPVVLRFNLSALKPAVASLSSAILEVELHMTNPTEYRVANPKIAGNTAAVAIQGIHVYVNTSTGSGVGSEDVNQGNLWDQLSVTAAVFALPNPLPTTPLGAKVLDTMALDIQAQSTSDVMTIGFDSLQ